ncbi:hypothetical protein L1987_26615 [Smallanthus sonchifolius]|uniref:Uncharacterized protein n=1 Tax=Smallanthus sonchifolius TaxID=185202 RepID=A0ACB9IAK9_9ASTR|nr:hypothetical protein L1987_26615 [Smallanthus sonchifolius]
MPTGTFYPSHSYALSMRVDLDEIGDISCVVTWEGRGEADTVTFILSTLVPVDFIYRRLLILVRGVSKFTSDMAKLWVCRLPLTFGRIGFDKLWIEVKKETSGLGLTLAVVLWPQVNLVGFFE